MSSTRPARWAMRSSVSVLERRIMPDDPVALVEQELGQVPAVLAGDAGDQRAGYGCEFPMGSSGRSARRTGDRTLATGASRRRAAARPATRRTSSGWPGRCVARPDVDLTAFLDAGADWPGDPDGDRRRPACAPCARATAGPHPAGAAVRARRARADCSTSSTSRRRSSGPAGRRRPRPLVRGPAGPVPDPDPAAAAGGGACGRRPRADAVLALSVFTRERILRPLRPRPVGRVRARPAVDGRFHPTDDEASGGPGASRRLGLPDRFVLHVGDLIPRKNVRAWSRRWPRCAGPGSATSGWSSPARAAATCRPSRPRSAEPRTAATAAGSRPLGYVADDALVDRCGGRDGRRLSVALRGLRAAGARGAGRPGPCS